MFAYIDIKKNMKKGERCVGGGGGGGGGEVGEGVEDLISDCISSHV